MTISNVQQFDFSVNLLRGLLWQDNQATKMAQLLTLKQEWYNANETDFWNSWVVNVFDLRTANQFGLAVWAIILGVSLTLILPPSDPGKPTWGFGSAFKNFNNGNFSTQASSSASLTIAQKRLLLQLRYLRLTTRCTVPEVNRRLAAIFAGQGGTIFLNDSYDMTCRYTMSSSLASSLAFVLKNTDLLPRPAACAVVLTTV